MAELEKGFKNIDESRGVLGGRGLIASWKNDFALGGRLYHTRSRIPF
jgi:hypothetical protein